MSDDPEFKSTGSQLVRSYIEKFQDKVTDISWGIFSIGFFASFLSIGYEVFIWLRNGEWPHLQFYAVFVWLSLDPFSPVNNIEWQGIKKILLWYLELPLSLGLLGLAAIVGGAFYAVLSRKD